MVKKAIILAGGTGSRLAPTSFAINKQLMMLYDKPVIYYPISLLMLIGIKNILIIVNKGQIKNFKKLLGNGKKFGLKLSYAEQTKPSGIPEAFKIGSKFIAKDNVALILGDNFFFGQGLTDILCQAKKNFIKGANIFIKKVKHPERYGIVKVFKNKIIKIIEKPNKKISNDAITGLYFFDNDVKKYAKLLRPSKRKETEITDLIRIYKEKNNLKHTYLGVGSVWSDIGTVDDMLQISNYISSINNIQNFKIACLEEIAINKKWIKKQDIKESKNKYPFSNYYEYIKKL